MNNTEKSRNQMIIDEMNRIINENWTDGISVSYGTDAYTENICEGVYEDINGNYVPVTEKTFIDVSSVTKLFTLVTILKLTEENKIDITKKISDYSKLSSYVNIQDIKLYELLNFTKNVVTSSRLDRCSGDEAEALLKSGIVENNRVFYSDIGSIIIVYILDDLFGKGFFRNYSEKLWKNIGMKNTFWWDDIPEDKYGLLQSYDNEYRYSEKDGIYCYHTEPGKPHDPKSKVLGASGHAGIFMTSEDISVFASELIKGNIISYDTINSFILSDAYDSFTDYGQHFGILCYKRAEKSVDSEIPDFASDKSIAISGYTGVYFMIDFQNRKFVFIASNRVHNRMTSLLPSDDISGEYKKVTNKYVYRKDVLRDLCYNYDRIL